MNIGILNSGGDCPGLNAVIEGVCGAASRRGWTTIGFYDGFEGLLSEHAHEVLTPARCRQIRRMGGTILGTVNKGNFGMKVGAGSATGTIDPAVLERAMETVWQLSLDGLVVVGGDGSQTTALFLEEAGLPIVGVPKTIDNDLAATEVTFGFDSAVATVSEALDRLDTTADAHRRVMVVEVMGRHAGWIALNGGIAGSADVILLPEIAFRMENVARAIQAKRESGVRGIKVVVAEGAKLESGQVYAEEKATCESRLGGIGAHLTREIERLTGIETRNCVLGHVQRGGSPTAFDRVLGVRFGAFAVEMIAEGKYGHMAALQCGEMVAVPIREAVSHLNLVDPASQVVRTGRDLGVSFGDE